MLDDGIQLIGGEWDVITGDIINSKCDNFRLGIGDCVPEFLYFLQQARLVR